MTIDFDLAFLYYHKKQILGAEDPKMEELRPHIGKFTQYINTVSLEDIIALLCYSYKEKYGQTHYWYGAFLIEDAYKITVDYPKELNEESDLYLPKEKMKRSDINSITFRRFDDFDNNVFQLKSLEMAFVETQDYLAFTEKIEEVLEGISYTKEELTEETIITVIRKRLS